MTRFRPFPCAALFAAAFAGGPFAAAQTTLVPRGATWKYLDNGSDPGTAWRAASFNDTAWASGSAQLGYGDGDEATVVSFGPDPNNKFITTYFRRAFNVTDPAAFVGLTVRLLRDDGGAVYLNGTEVFRSNLPGGAIASGTLASVAVSGADETTTFYETAAAASLLVAGTNVLAVEIHQSGGTSSDVSFDLELLGQTAVAVTRGPYLQRGTPTAVTLRWRTAAATDSVVRYGAGPSALTQTAAVAGTRTDHAVSLAGLSADTVYYYSVGATSGPFAGGTPDFAFRTPPVAGTDRPLRLWVLGDSGTANVDARAVRDAYLSFAGTRPTDLWLMLGDNAYSTGTDAEYQAGVFDTYPSVLRSSVLWATLGNHDGATADSASQTGPYYDIFTLPANAEAGGLASGTEAYYSFDWANIHFVCLESYETNRSPGGAMLTWLANDLASTTRRWIVAFWHHPPYSKGSHNSDTEIELIEMRQNALPILEAAGVDLVLTGHSHSYERSFLLDQHYGGSGTLTTAMKKDGGDGRPAGNGAYRKPTAGPAAHEGAVYVVAGSSGQVSGGTLDHPAMFVSLNRLGSLVLDVDGNRLEAKFLGSTGLVEDSFAIVKGPAQVTVTAPAGGGTFSGGNPVSVAWTTAGTVAGVTIRLSVDGGASYPFVLASGTANDGAETVTLPAGVSTTRARVRVSDAADDAVNDASDADFTIQSAGIAVPLAAGYTLVGLPLTPATAYTAETLAQEINAQAGTNICTAVLRYAGGSFQTHPVGTGIANFPIAVGEGCFVRCTQAGTWTVSGTPFSATTAALNLAAGYNLVALPLEPDPQNPYTADRAGVEAGATQVLRYVNGAFETHPVGTTVRNFTLATGQGYFVRCAAPTTWNVRR